MAEKKKETAKKAVDKKSAKVDKDEAQKKASEVQAEKVVEESKTTDAEKKDTLEEDVPVIEPPIVPELKEKKVKQEDEAQKKARLKAERELFLQQTAETLMRENSVKEIWRDVDTGYWFTTKEYADAHAQKKGSQLKLTKYTL